MMRARLLRGLLAGFVLTLAVGFGGAPRAVAADYWDIFDSFDVQATLNPDGTVDVIETVTLRFGESSGRHGLERTLFTREPDPDTGQDMVFPITQISAESLTSGVSGMTDISHHEVGNDPRQTYVRIRIGDPDRTIVKDTASYRLRYTIGGLMRSPGGDDQLYWDMTGSAMPEIRNFTATIVVPGGAQELFCSSASPGNRADCTSQQIDDEGRALITQEKVWRGELVTVGVRVTPGLITQNTPLFEPDARQAQRQQGQNILLGSFGAAGLVGVAGWAVARRRTGDLRYEGLPPGVLPAPGASATEVRDRKDIQIPVAFSPPPVPLAAAGLLLDATGKVRHTTATLVSLAVNGAIKLRSEEPAEARLVDADRAPDEPSRALLAKLFPSGRKKVSLASQGTLTGAHDAVKQAATESGLQGSWFLPAHSGSFAAIALSAAGVFGLIAMTVVAGGVWLNLWPLAVATVITGIVVSVRLGRPRRTGTGRALTDQVEGFRTYLATAEAEQLRFEEGEDIFSKYLPWAILFDLADRWVRVCEKLVEMGRLSPQAPVWYYGSQWNLTHMGTQFDTMSTSVQSAVTPIPSTSDSGWGSGGSSFSSSSFGGGGFSGGGGGGGGGGSW